MPNLQEQYDDAMFAFSQGDLDRSIGLLRQILAEDPHHFDAQLSLGMAYYRQANYGAAIEEGLKAEKLNPKEQLVHTNLSLFYMKAGDKVKAEHHGLQARIASWRDAPPGETTPSNGTPVEMARTVATAAPTPPQFPDMPWKKKPPTKD